ncbi:MAG: arginine--tRNA ligase [Chloroflexi bacterium]|nr:arginine--tRNA ligase [Chloroflexota bacterium]
MIKDEIVELLRAAVLEAQRTALLPQVALPEITVEHPASKAHGDYASNVALKLARAARMSPLAIAREITKALPPAEFLDRVEVAPPGFINLTLSKGWLISQVEHILAEGDCYGGVDLGHGVRVQVEYVSANPTGPLHAASGRAGALGDTLAKVLTACGYSVSKEYYINDAGSRMDAFYQTLFARYIQALGGQAEIPADGYAGQYMVDLAEHIVAREGRRFLEVPPDEAVRELGRLGLQIMADAARQDLQAYGVSFDVWFSEQSLFDSSLVQKAVGLLRDRGCIAEKEGATWFVSTPLGEDKDNVLVRSNGIPTYFASDVAYHYDKFAIRKFQRVIDIWGADHQGHVPRMKAAVGALGFNPDDLTIIIHQMVTLKRGDKIVKMSKRTGDIVTLREVLEEVGPDACRFNFLARSADSHMDFDLQLAVEQSNENPVYYVQYAHARIASILRYAEELEIDFSEADLSLLQDEAELGLIRHMSLLPEIVELSAVTLEPHRLPFYAVDLASIFHSFYKVARVVDRNDLPLTRARLKLVQSAKIVLANTLHLMGMTAPESM